MATYGPEKFCLKCNVEIVIRNLEPLDIDKYLCFSESMAKETTHTLYFPEQSISIDAMKEQWDRAIECPWRLELGGFHNDKLVSHLTFLKPRANHPYEQHTLQFGIKILKAYCSQ